MIKKITAIAMLTAILASCSTSNEVVSNGLFQKRKYNKGWYANKSTKVKETKGEQVKDVYTTQEELAINNSEEIKVASNKEEVKPISKQYITKEDVVAQPQKTVLASTDKKEEKIVSTSVVIAEEQNAVAFEELKKVSETAPVEIKQGESQSGDTSSNGHPMILLYLLAIFIPFVAVGLVTDWEATPTISNILWTLLCGIPGIIHAFIIIARYR